MMKKILVIALALLVGAQAHAQLVAKAAFLNASDRSKFDNNVNSVNLSGFSLGAEYKIALPFVDGLGVAPGANVNFLFGSENEFRYSDIALNIPLHATYSFDFGRDFRAYAFGGPSAQIGLIKNSKYTVGNQTNSLNYYSNESSSTYNRFMLLLGLGAGVEVAEMIQVSVGVDFGVTPFFRNDYIRVRRPYQLKIGVGYLF